MVKRRGGSMNYDGQVWNLNSSRNVYGAECDGQVLGMAGDK